MKLTVGRIVHAHHASSDSLAPGGFLEPDERPFAAIVTGVDEWTALLRILDPAGKNFDQTVKVSLSPDSLRRPGADGWLWRWPPRES